jgi:hypothetical protein
MSMFAKDILLSDKLDRSVLESNLEEVQFALVEC